MSKYGQLVDENSASARGEIREEKGDGVVIDKEFQ